MFSIRFILNILYTYVTFEYNSHLEKILKRRRRKKKITQIKNQKQLISLDLQVIPFKHIL